jgi:hypothetical protein
MLVKLGTAVLAACASLAVITAPPAAADGLCTVTATNVNLRSGPGTGYDKRGKVYAGAQVFNQGEAWGNRPADGYLWIYGGVVNGPDDIWIRSDFLRC